MNKKYTYDKLMDALNRLDEGAEVGNTEYEEKEQQSKDYTLLADFIKEMSKPDKCSNCGKITEILYLDRDDDDFKVCEDCI